MRLFKEALAQRNMHLTLVFPRLLSLPRDVLLASAPLAAMARRAVPARHQAAGIDAALLVATGSSADTPVAPLAARGAGLAGDERAIARADPVTLIAGRDDVLLGGRVDDLSSADAEALIAKLNAHFAPDGLAFIAARPDTWFLRLAAAGLPVTTSLAQVKGALSGHLPRGTHAGPWKRWLSEMQMLLHDDPSNIVREHTGRQPVTAIWIADAGPSLVAEPVAPRRCFAVAGRGGDVARGIAADPTSVPAPPLSFEALPPGSDALVVLPQSNVTEDPAPILDAWLAPAIAALDRGALTGLCVIVDDGAGAWIYAPRAASWWTRCRLALTPARFAPPVLAEA